MLQFLQQLYVTKNNQIGKLQNEIAILDGDIKRVKERRRDLGFLDINKPISPFQIMDATNDSFLNSYLSNTSTNNISAESNGSARSLKRSRASISNPDKDYGNTPSDFKRRKGDPTLNTPKIRIEDTPNGGSSNQDELVQSHFRDLEKAYFSVRRGCVGGGVISSTEREKEAGLSQFNERLASLTSKTNLIELMSTEACADSTRMNNIISGVGFSKNEEILAAAGVTKKIFIFDYLSILKSSRKLEPCLIINWHSKFSSLSWNRFIKQQLATSDYDGLVSLWDSSVGSQVQTFSGHENRVWNVDCCSVNPARLASSSDDGTVKIWDSNSGVNPAMSVTPKGSANICSVKFQPQ